jgi:flagellar capping protein FliD
MATINFPGLSTGIDTNAIITQLIAANSGRLNAYKKSLSALQDKQEALVTFTSNLSALQTAVRALSDAQNLRSFNISTSNEDVVTADANSSAYQGSHSIVVNQLATADRWVLTSGFKYKEDFVSPDSPGTFIYSYNGKETSITTTTTTTLEDLVGLINNDADNPGVTASLLSYNNQYHLVLSSNSAGSDYEIHINPSNTEVWQSSDLLTVNNDNADTTSQLTKLDCFDGITFNGDENIVISGTDHTGKTITPVTLPITANTKVSHLLDEIENAFDGNVIATLDNGKIVVTDKFSGDSSLTIGLTFNDNGSSTAFTTMAESTKGGCPEVWQAAGSLTVDGSNADSNTAFVGLDQFGSNPLEGGETIQISGTDHNGNTITPATLALTDTTKISDLLSEIESAFGGKVNATFENGRIVVTDKISGASSLSVSLTYNPNGSSATLDLPAMAVATEGSGTGASLVGFTSADFTRSQIAQDSKVKVDGFPSQAAVSEVQQIAHSSAITSGTFTLSYGGYTTSAISYDATIEQIQAALDALSGVQPGDITVSGDALNSSGTLIFNFKNTLGDVSNILINSSNLSDPTVTNTEQTKGVDEFISRSSNTIDDVVDGITFYLHGTSDSQGEQITLTRNTDLVITKINALVTNYNTLASFIKDKTGYNASTNVAGVLMGDYTVSTINDQLYSTLVTQAQGFISDVDKYLMPAQIGLTLDENGQLSFDSSVFNTAVSKSYQGVLDLLGATKSGASNSSTIRFYSASDKFTTAGQYDVRVTISGGVITSAQIKLADQGESAWRDMTISDNMLTGNSSFDSNGNPVYPENGLQFSVDLSSDGTYSANVSVKQGFAGALEDILNSVLKADSGVVDIDSSSVDDDITNMQERIDQENDRLDTEKTNLTAKFARLEATLTILRSQLSILTGYYQ